ETRPKRLRRTEAAGSADKAVNETGDRPLSFVSRPPIRSFGSRDRSLCVAGRRTGIERAMIPEMDVRVWITKAVTVAAAEVCQPPHIGTCDRFAVCGVERVDVLPIIVVKEDIRIRSRRCIHC